MNAAIEMNDGQDSHWARHWETYAFVLAIAGTTTIWILWRYWGAALLLGNVASASAPSGDRVAQLGQLGDLFGGINALFTAWAFAGVIWAGLLQRRDIAMQAKDLADSRQVMRDQQAVMQQQQEVAARQQFEATFFNLLAQLRLMTDRVTFASAPMTGTSGVVALDQMAADIDGMLISSRQKEPPVLLVLAVDQYHTLYLENETTLGPYFRTMYHAFKFIDRANLDGLEKVNYANIARSQLSEGAIFLLSLNCLTEPGWGFKALVERYGLLKHLSVAKRGRYLAALSLPYRPHAFVHANERSSLEWPGEMPTIEDVKNELARQAQLNGGLPS